MIRFKGSYRAVISLMLVGGLLSTGGVASAALPKVDKNGNPTYDIRTKRAVDANLLKLVGKFNEFNAYYFVNQKKFTVKEVVASYTDLRGWAWFYKYYYQRVLTNEEVSLNVDPTSPAPSELVDLYNDKIKLHYCLVDIRYLDKKPYLSEPLVQRLVLSSCDEFLKGKSLLKRILPRESYVVSPFTGYTFNNLFNEKNGKIDISVNDSNLLSINGNLVTPTKISDLKLFFEFNRFGNIYLESSPFYQFKAGEDGNIEVSFTDAFNNFKSSTNLNCINPGLVKDYPLTLKIKFVESYTDKSSITGYLNPIINLSYC